MTKLFILPFAIAWVLHFGTILLLKHFRKGIKEGDIVGVEFGDEIINRTIISLHNDQLTVWNKSLVSQTSVHRNRVYIPVKWEQVDEKG